MRERISLCLGVFFIFSCLFLRPLKLEAASGQIILTATVDQRLSTTIRETSFSNIALSSANFTTRVLNQSIGSLEIDSKEDYTITFSDLYFVHEDDLSQSHTIPLDICLYDSSALGREIGRSSPLDVSYEKNVRGEESFDVDIQYSMSAETAAAGNWAALITIDIARH